MHEKSRGRCGGLVRRRIVTATFFAAGLLTVLLYGCRDELGQEIDTNLPPDTYLTGVPAESTTTFYRAHLFWYGNDADGRVVSYEYAITDSFADGDEDTLSYHHTTRTDSIFVFQVGTSQQVLGRRFYIRAIDNEGAVDPEPAWTFFGAIDLIPPKAVLTLAEAFKPGVDSVYRLTSTDDVTPTDTVDTGWSVRFAWQGIDADREINEQGDTVTVGSIVDYEYWLVPEPAPVSVDLEDTFIVFPGVFPGEAGGLLESRPYGFNLWARDDAGFKGLNPTVRTFVWNRDPNTWMESIWDPARQRNVPKFVATSAAWPGSLHFIDGDTIPLVASSTGGLHAVNLTIRVDGADPDDDPANPKGVDRFMQKIGADRWKAIAHEDSIDKIVRLVGLKTTQKAATLNVRCADSHGRPDGSPAQLNFNVNRAPRLPDQIQLGGGETFELFPPRHSTVLLDSLIAWGDSIFRLKVRILASDPDSTTDRFKYGFRFAGKGNLFHSGTLDEPSGSTDPLEALVPYEHATAGIDTLYVLIREDPVNESKPYREGIGAVPFYVQ